MVNVVSVPYNSCIVAHEKMSAFAYISILEVILKLVIVYLLILSSSDKLIVYAILVLIVSILIRFCYTLYCKRYFEECNYRFIFNKSLFKEMFSFASWSVIGNLGFGLKDQISNIILNIFYGTTLNAARGIGIQVSSIVNTFSSNFSVALNPQITKQYAAGNIEESQKLVYIGTRYTFYLLTLISIPFIVNIDYILKIWLGIVPEYTSNFLILSLMTALLYSLSGCITVAIQATGKIKIFQIGISLLMLSELPIAYLLLKLNFPPYSVMYPTIFTYIVAIFFRFYLIKRMIPTYSFRYYLFKVLIPSMVIFILCWALCYIICKQFEMNLLLLFLTSVISVFIISCIILILGMDKIERMFIIRFIKKKIKHYEY